MYRSNNLLIFVLGAMTGSLATWYWMKKKYEVPSQEDEEIEETNDIQEEETPEEPDTVDVPSFKREYENVVSTLGYTNYSNLHENKQTNNDDDADKPYVISPDEFGEIHYTQIEWTYFADGFLADENYDLVEDIENTIGFDALNHFGDYEDDAVHVRNDRLKCEYEILQDRRKYKEVVKKFRRMEE